MRKSDSAPNALSPFSVPASISCSRLDKPHCVATDHRGLLTRSLIDGVG